MGPSTFALIIGAMKSGTTTLFELLAQHPQVCACNVKEPRFFSIDAHWERGWDWYTELWDWDPSTHRVALEASTNYTTFPERPGVPERISGVGGASFRFIYILRNPLDQIESHVRHTLYLGWGKSLDEGVPGWMIDTVRYATQIDRYLAMFPRNSLLLLTLDDLNRNPAGVLQKTCRFLGVDEHFPFEGIDERYNSGEAYQVSSAVAALMRAAPLRWLAARLLPRGLRHRVRSLVPRLGGRKRDMGRYELNAIEKASILAELEPERHRLVSEHGVPFDHEWRLADVPQRRDTERPPSTTT